MEKVYWSERSGRRYLVVDYARADGAQMLEILAEAVRVIGAEPEPFPMLGDVTDAAMTTAWLTAIKSASRDVLGPKVSRCAVLGVTGIKATMLRGFNTVGGGLRALPFRDEEQALAYLLQL
jgi:hypothetical protein